MRYEVYKDINLPWLPVQIPAHWELRRHKNVLSEHRDYIGNRGKQFKMLSLTMNGVIIRDTESGKGKFSKDVDKYVVVSPGDFVFCLFDVDETPRTVGLSKFEGMITGAYDVFTPHDINPEFFYYYYLSLDNVKALKPLYSGLRKVIGFSTFMGMYFSVPPREEQDQIVRYLDWKVSCINKLIHGYQRQIKLLEERRQTVIDRAVTKGVRSDRQMQHIQANWMGDIPNDWRMIPAKRLFIESKARKFADDKPATASQKYGIILQEDYMQREGKRIVIATQGLDDWKHVNPDDFVISLRSFQGGIERSEISGCVTWHYIVLLPQKYASPRYFKWLFKSKSYIKALQGTSEFIRDGQDLRYSNFVKVSLPLIPVEEQDEIADYIECETAKIDASIPVFEKQIALLKEYRTRLISDVVTGQMDVRGIVVPEYAPETDEEDEEVDEPLSDAGEESEV